MFAFRMHPASITVGEGINSAWRFFVAASMKWVPVALAVGVAYFVAYAAVLKDAASWYYTDPFTGRSQLLPEYENKAGEIALAYLLIVVVAFAASCVVTAMAVAGLRNRPLSPSWILSRSLVLFVSAFIVAAAAVGVAFVIALVVGVIAVNSLGLAIVAMLALIVVALIPCLRLVFIGFSVFDGHGPIDAISESWRLADRGMLRILGWVLLASLIAIVIVVGGAIVAAPFGSAKSEPLGQAVIGAVSAAASTLTLFILTALYESQRARREIIDGRAAWAGMPGYGPGSAPSWPPVPYAAGYPGGPYPGAPNAMPSYPAPAYPAAAYPPGPGYPGGPYPGAPWPQASPPAGYPGAAYQGAAYQGAAPNPAPAYPGMAPTPTGSPWQAGPGQVPGAWPSPPIQSPQVPAQPHFPSAQWQTSPEPPAAAGQAPGNAGGSGMQQTMAQEAGALEKAGSGDARAPEKPGSGDARAPEKPGTGDAR